MPDRNRPETARLVPAPRENLCLDLANTRYWRGSDPPTETLHGLDDVLAWCEDAKVLDGAATEGMRQWGRAHEGAAAALFGEVVEIRESLYRLFGAAAAGTLPADGDIGRLNGLLAETPRRADVARADGFYAWRLPPAEPVPASLLAPVLWSAGDLMVGTRSARVRRCANDACRWLFLDDSKSGTRRWCSMSSCGNRAKAHRHYVRHKAR